MALKVSAPNMRLRTTSGVHRSARISEARATGQYWPYVRTQPLSRRNHRLSSSISGLLSADGVPNHEPMNELSTSAATGQVTREAADLYERFFVPALFVQWPDRLFRLAGLEAGDRVLDVACGTGVLARAARAGVGPTGLVEGVDVNDGMLAVARRIAPDLTWTLGRAEDLPAADRWFDRVFCQFGLMFFVDRPAAIREMARVVTPPGRICVATWAGLSETPGYAEMIGLLDELFGAAVAQALTAPFTIGTPSALGDLVTTAFDDVEVHQLAGEARFPSIEAWVTTDIRAWTLRDMLEHDEFDELVAQAHIRLRGFCDDSGAVSFPAPALVAVASP